MVSGCGHRLLVCVVHVASFSDPATIDPNINLCKHVGKLLYLYSVLSMIYNAWLICVSQIVGSYCHKALLLTPVLSMISNGQLQWVIDLRGHRLMVCVVRCQFPNQQEGRFYTTKKTTQPQQ